MLSTLLPLLLATSAAAAPALNLINTATPALNSTPWDGVRALLPHEVLLVGRHADGSDRAEVVHVDVYDRLFKRGENVDKDLPTIFGPDVLPHRPADELMDEVATRSIQPEADKAIEARGCAVVTTAIQDRMDKFVDWDVQMSPVVASNTPLTVVTVTSGWSIANSVGIAVGLDRTLIEKILGASLNINFKRTWTTEASAAVSYVISEGFSGTIVTNPITYRHYGHISAGCVGAQRSIGTFTADSHEDGNYHGVAWVNGAIKLCQKRSYPLTRCEGSGEFR